MSSEPASVEQSTLLGDYTPASVPAALMEKVIKDSTIFVDVLNAGAMAGTGLTDEQATESGMSKNHWLFRGLIDSDVGKDGEKGTWQIQFGMELKEGPSIGSMEVHYAGSSRLSRPGNSSGEIYSDVSSINNPPALDSEGSVPAALPAAAAGSNGGGGAKPAIFSDVGSQDIPPSIPSSDGGIIQQPTKGAPFPGVLNIKVRNRTAASFSVFVVFSFDLAPGTTFGKLLEALTTRGMESFRFRKLGVAYLGCRDFISQAAAAWLHDGLMMTGDGLVVMGTIHAGSDKHIYSLLCWRYTRPLVPANLSDSDDQSTECATGRTPNAIDRAVWSDGFIHVEDTRLQYNQAVNA